ncbi:MAG: cyclase family protein [Povalibacter sp.]
MSNDKRVQFDFVIEFLNGGALQGQDFRLDIDRDDIEDRALADYIVRDLRLLMVAKVSIMNKQIISESHKRTDLAASASDGTSNRLIDLSHTIEDGMITYKGLPAPLICDHLSRTQSRDHYAPGTEFQIGKITMVSNTGTYIDSPFHRFADGTDIADLTLSKLANMDALLVRIGPDDKRAIPRDAFAAFDLRGKAVLIETDWDRHWRTDQYFEGHPYLTADAAEFLRSSEVTLVGIDSLNIDDTRDLQRPVHTTLLGAGIPIVEHLTGLAQLPLTGFRFSAVPPKVRGMGTFPVRAYATL